MTRSIMPLVPPKRRDRFALRHALVLLCLLLSPSLLFAVVPNTIGLEGRLETQAGGPVADGTYEMVLSLYSTSTSKTSTWYESAKVVVKSGRFAFALGSSKALSPKILDATQSGWIGVQVGKDPELPRVALHSVAYAHRAALADNAALADSAKIASGLSCTGCVSVSALKFDGDLDLGGNSIKTKNLVATGEVVAAKVTASSLVGDGSQLTGIQVAGGSCKAGQVVTAVKSDGSVVCGVATTGSELFAGKLTDSFVEEGKASQMPVSIPDNTGATASAQLSLGKVGVAKALSVKVTLSNSDLSSLRLKLYPPNDKKVGLTLCDPCGAKGTKSLSKIFDENSKLQSGSLQGYVGKSVEGIWTLEALDTAFCQPQIKGNAALCDTTKKIDGQVSDFHLSATVTSSQSVKVKATLQLALLETPPFACLTSRKGHMYFDTKLNKVRFCDGKVWRSVGDTCGDGIIDAGEQCDDGNNTDGDGCTSSCTTICGDKVVAGSEQCDDGNTVDNDACTNTCVGQLGWSKDKPAMSCSDLLSKAKVLKSDTYWIDPDGAAGVAPYQVKCEMELEGGGWTRVIALKGNTDKSLGGVANSQEFVDNGTFLFSKTMLKKSNREVLIVETVSPYRRHRYDFKQYSNVSGDNFVGALTGDLPATVAIWNYNKATWQSAGKGQCNTNNHSQWNCEPATGVRFHYATRDWTGNGGSSSNDGWSWFTGYDTSNYGNYSHLVKNWNGAYDKKAHDIYVR